MRIAFTGGGTGGHIFPNIAVIRRIQDTGNREQGRKIFYIGEKNGMEERICHEENIPFYGIHAGKWRRYFDMKNILDAVKVPLGFFESLWILKKLKPDLIFAKGGYVSFPVILAARALKKPVWLHESDVSPGLANRMCSRFAKKIFVSFEESRKFFPHQHVEVVGNPVRSELLKGSPQEGYRLTGFSKNKPVIFVLGGSLGAQSLNKLVVEALPQLLKKYQVVHMTGPVMLSLSKHNEAKQSNYKTFPFLNEELAHIYAIADIIVSRAGSSAIFEFLALKKPMILIPLPKTASRGDQIENAEIFAKHGWTLALQQEEITPQRLVQSIENLLDHDMLRREMVERQKSAEFTNAASQIAQAIRQYDKKD